MTHLCKLTDDANPPKKRGPYKEGRSCLSTDAIMTSVFVAAVIAATVFALRTGKAIYGSWFFRFLYLERSRHPVVFWALIGWYWIAAALAIAEAASPGFLERI